MANDITDQLATSLSRYQAMVVGGLCFILIFSISMMGVMLYLSYSLGEQSSKLEAVAVETHDTLCTFKFDLSRRYSENTKLLKENPELIEKLGLSESQVQQSRSAQLSTLRALNGLDCKGQ